MSNLRDRLERLSERGIPRGADAVLDSAECDVLLRADGVVDDGRGERRHALREDLGEGPE